MHLLRPDIASLLMFANFLSRLKPTSLRGACASVIFVQRAPPPPPQFTLCPAVAATHLDAGEANTYARAADALEIHFSKRMR
jgi:hypothetical protein